MKLATLHALEQEPVRSEGVDVSAERPVDERDEDALLHLLDGLAEADHDAGLRRHLGREVLHAIEERERALVVALRPRARVEPRHGLDVVREHLRCGVEDLLQQHGDDEVCRGRGEGDDRRGPQRPHEIRALAQARDEHAPALLQVRRDRQVLVLEELDRDAHRSPRS